MTYVTGSTTGVADMITAIALLGVLCMPLTAFAITLRPKNSNSNSKLKLKLKVSNSSLI